LREDQVPDFPKANQDPGVNRFLAKHGLRYEQRPITDPAPAGWHTIEGTSPRGGEHAVVGFNGRFKFDPHPQDGTGRGLVKKKTWGVLMPIDQEVKPVGDEELGAEAALICRDDLDIGMRPGDIAKKNRVPLQFVKDVQKEKFGTTAFLIKRYFKKNSSASGHITDSGLRPRVPVYLDGGWIRLIDGMVEVHPDNKRFPTKEFASEREALNYLANSTVATDSGLRPKDIKRGPGAFTVQLTDPDGREHTEPVSSLRTYDSVDPKREARIRALGKIEPHQYQTPKPGSASLPCKQCGLSVWAAEHKVKATDGLLSNTAMLLAALYAWYRSRMDEPAQQPRNWDLTTYVPRQRAFDAFQVTTIGMRKVAEAERRAFHLMAENSRQEAELLRREGNTDRAKKFLEQELKWLAMTHKSDKELYEAYKARQQ
jgi:hypothetical protein